MRKLSIPSQLIILFFAIILVSMLTFTLATVMMFEQTYEADYFERIKTAAENIQRYEAFMDKDDLEIIKTNAEARGETHYRTEEYADSLVNIVFYKYYGSHPLLRTEYVSRDYNQFVETYLDKETVEDIKNKSNFARENNVGVVGKERFGKNVIYYGYYTTDNGDSYTLVLATDAFVSIKVQTVVIELSIMFFLIIIVAVLVIYLWSNALTKRIKKIQTHVLDLPKNKYETSYRDDADDELGELSRAIDELRIEVMKSEQTKREMLQNISHDFKTPIAVIKSYAEAIEDGMAEPNAPSIIINQANSLTKKVSYLLQYNSLEYLSKDREFEDVNMTALINEVVDTFRYQTSLKFELLLESDIIFKGYRENWYTIVSNIIDNAKRYAKTRIKIVLKKDRLRIFNDGDPIDEKFTDSRFKPYEKGSKGQFGLGMSIVKKTVDFFDMELKVVNEAKGGVSFIIERRPKKI